MAFLMSAYMGQGIEYKSWDLVLHLWKKKHWMNHSWSIVHTTEMMCRQKRFIGL